MPLLPTGRGTGQDLDLQWHSQKFSETEGGFPLPSRLEGLGKRQRGPGGAPAEIEFYTVWMPKKPSGDTYS